MFHNTRRILGTFKYVISRNRGLENRKNDLLTGHGVENITNIRITMFISLFIGLIALIAYATALSLNALLVFSMMFIFMSWYIGHLPNDKLSEDLDTHFGKHNFNPYKSYLGGRILITSRGVSLSLSKRTPLNIISRRQELTLKLAEAKALAALPAPKDKSTSKQNSAAQTHLKAMPQARADAYGNQCCTPTTTATATANESNASPLSLGANPNNASQAYGNATAHTNVYGANDAAHLVDANVASAFASSHAIASADAVADAGAGASVGDESNCARGDAYANENAGATPCTSANACACTNELSANFLAATNGAQHHEINAHASGVQACGHEAIECVGSAIHAYSESAVAMSESMRQTGRAAGAACDSMDKHNGLGGGGAQASGFGYGLGSGDGDAAGMHGKKMASLRARKLVGAMFMDRPCSDAEDFVIGRALHMAQCADGNACSALNSGFMTTLETPLLSGVRLYPGIPMTDACCCQLISAIANKLNHTDKSGHALSVANAASAVIRGTDKALTFAANLLGGKEDGSDYAHVLNNHCATGRADLAKSNGQWVPPYHSSMRKMVRPKDVTFWGFGFIWGAEHTRLLHHKLEIGLRRAAYGSNGSPDIHAIGGQYHAYEPIYLPESNLKGHTLLLGTTGAGKTRFFDLEISQAIARGDTVIVIDPKGDRQLLRSIVRAAKDAGRDPIQDLFILDLSRKQFTPGADKHSFTCYDRCRGIVKPFGMEGSDDAADCSNLRGKDGLNRDNLADLNDYWATASDVDHELMTAPCDSLITDDMLNFDGYSMDAATGRVSVPTPAQHGSGSGSGSGAGFGWGLGSEAYAADGFCCDAMSFDGPRSEQDIAMMDALKRSEEFFANSSDKNHLQGGGEFRATFSNLYDSPASRFNERLMQDEHYQDVIAPAASAFAGTTGNWQGKELDVDDIIINCSNYGINPVGAFDQPAQIGARLTSMLSSSGSSASFKNYSNMAVTAAVVCCQLSGKHITVENIRDLVTDPNALQVALRRYINYKVEQIDNEVVQRLWNTIHGVGGPLNGIKGVVTAALGPHATGEAPVGNYHEIIDGLIKEGKISRAAFKSVLEQMKHSPTRPSKADLLTLFGNIAELDPIADASAITSLALSLFDSASERKEAEEACASTYVDVHEGDSVDATDILFANRESSTDPGASADISDENAAANAAANADAAPAEAQAEAEATAATPARKTRSRSKKTTTTTTKKTTTKRNTKKAPTLTASKKRVMCAQAENEVLQAFYDWLGKSGLCDDLVDCQIVFMVTALPVEYYRKVTNSVVPYLGSLTGGLLRGLLSGSRNGQALPSLRDLIEGNKIFVADIHCLKDATTGQNLGKMLLSDLAFVAGDINATGAQLKRISVFIDEASELADEALVQLLNKSRSAGFSITIATQSIADLSQRSGSKDAAHQIVANCNNLIAMRVNDPETAAIVSSVLPHTSVAQRSASVQYASDVFCGLTSIGHGLSMQDASLFPPDVLMMLPDFEYVARFSDGSCYKGFIPRLAPDEEVYPDIAKHKTATHAATSVSSSAATTFVPSSSTARAEAASSATAASSAACASAAPFASSGAAYSAMTPMAAMEASNRQTNSYAPFSPDTASNGMPKSNHHAALALNCIASMQQSSVNAAALASINTMAANGGTTVLPGCNASQGTAYAAANGGISMYAANELGNATQNGQFAMAQTNGAVVSAMGISSSANDNDILDQVLWPDGVMMPGNYSPARESADGVSACFKEQFTDAQLMNNLKDPGKISLFYRRQHLEQMVKETTQESYAAYRNPEGFRLGNSSHSFHGIESPIHYFKERFSWQSFKAERDPKVRLALLLALPLLMLKYLFGSALIMFIHTISFIKNKVLKSVLTELLMIAFIGLNLGLMIQDNFIEENADLIWDVYCYFQNLGESIYYCITNVTLCCPYLSYDNIADIISVGFIMIDWYIRNPSLMYSLILLGIMIGSHSKLMSAIHHTTPPASGLLTPSVNYLWSHKLSYVIVIIILTSFLVGFGVIFGREIAYLSTAGFLLISGYFVGAALTRTAK
ncbi:type IV secretion system DNA-binding domain-containing protein [uncultured Anaerobiospirillum sp.]|uniref:type IV secretion system DNA-binding domain-containing protein n=1 Tax=uncultured Anaerobiospirillum sp. TaxID=265728 RepID=UPI0028046587|nr:type IV secretion system DNA-binding domain-containing protein [uncultured Anaerobiospirillum sp.]